MSFSLNRVMAIATNTFKESIRNRVFIGMMLGALVMIFASFIISEMVVFDQRKRVIQDFGLFFISFAGVLIAITIGVLLVYNELKRKTIYSLLPKPIHRYEFIVGRYVGIFIILLVMALILSGAWFVVMLFRGVPLQPIFVKAVILILGELAIVSALAILFSSFSSPVLSGIFTFGIYVLGRQVQFIEELIHAKKGLFVSVPSLKPLGHAVASVFPDLSLFDITMEVLLEVNVGWGYVFGALAYALAYVIVFIIAAAVIFQRRDFV